MKRRPFVMLAAATLTTLLMASPVAARFDEGDGGGDSPPTVPSPDPGGDSTCDPAYMWCSGSNMPSDTGTTTTTEVPPDDTPASDPWATDAETDPWTPPASDPSGSDPTVWFEPEPVTDPVSEPDPTTPVTDRVTEPDPTTPVTDPVIEPVTDPVVSPSCDPRLEPCLDPGDTVPVPADPAPVPDPVPPVVTEPPEPDPVPVTDPDPEMPACDPEAGPCDDAGDPAPDPCPSAADKGVQVSPMGIVVTPDDPCPEPPCAPVVEQSPFSWFDLILRPQGIIAVPVDACAPDACPTAPVLQLRLFSAATGSDPICAGALWRKTYCEVGASYDDPVVAKFCGEKNAAVVKSRVTESKLDVNAVPVKQGPVAFEISVSGSSSLNAELKAFIAKYFSKVDLNVAGDGSISGTFKGRICWNGTMTTTTSDKTVEYEFVYTGGYRYGRTEHKHEVSVRVDVAAHAC